MCGIFAIVSNKQNTDAAQTVLSGLKKLEYRGYDSWGIAIAENEKIKTDKHIGKIGDAKTSLPKSLIGLGHTRWATHGGVTVPNAHPFLSCKKDISLVHNGIIDNYLELKKGLKDKHTFKSETDSEILLHLIEEYKEKMSLTQAVRRAFKKAHGLNAILVLSKNKVIAAKTGSPLVVGLGKNENYIASDLWSVLDHTRQVVFMEDGQLVEMSANKARFVDINSGKTLKPEIQKITWKAETARLNNHPHFMIKEIYEQPDLVKSLLVNKNHQTKKLAGLIKKSGGTFFVACGTASYAAIAGQYFFSDIANIHVNPAIGSEFIHYANFLGKKSLLIALSQSGETIDTIQSVDMARNKKSTVASLVNVLGSTLYRKSDLPILLEAGPEKAVASTKAFIAKITLLLMTASHLANKTLPKIEISFPRKKIKNLAKKIKNSKSIFVVGRGVSYPAALEVALKIKEISYIHAEGLPGGELKHGPIALIEKGTPCIVIAPPDNTYSDTISGAMEVKARGGIIIGISSKNHEVFDEYLPIADLGPASIIPAVIHGQLLAYELALCKGLDPDKPRNLAKSVTVK